MLSAFSKYQSRVSAVAMVLVTVLVYLLSSFAGGFIIYVVYNLAKGLNIFSGELVDSTGFEFVYSILVYGLLLYGIIKLFAKYWRIGRREAGITKPQWADPIRALAVLPVYYFAYFLTITVVTALVPSFNAEQSQPLGFEKSGNSPAQLVLIFLSLVVIPPIVEEIVTRGYLYTGLKKKLKKIPAVLVTSLVFAMAHLQLGGGGPLVWVAAVFTFVLSLFLIYLREKTGRIWASVCLHTMVNGISFIFLFVVGTN